MAQAGTVWVDVRGDMSKFASDVAGGAKKAGASVTSALGSGAKTVVSDLGTAAGVTAVAIGGIGLAAVKTSTDFNAAMSGVGAVANASAEDLEKLRDSALKAGADTVFSASQAAEAQAELVKAGVSVSDTLGGALTGSLSLAAAGQLELADAATISAQAMNIFGLGGADVSHIADVLAAGANKSAADVGQLGDALRQGGLVAKQTGLSMEETVGVLSMFADNALIGSDAGTSLKTMLQHLVPQSDDAAEAMKSMGLKFFDAQGAFVGIDEVARQLHDSLSGLDDAQRQQALTTLFGSDAVRGASILMDRGKEGVDEYTAAVNDMGAAQEMAAAQTDNLKGDLEAFSGSVETALIRVGDLGDTSLRGVTQAATEMVDVFNDFATTPTWDAISRNVEGLATGAGGVLTGLSGDLRDVLASISPEDVDRAFGAVTSGLSTIRESLKGAEGVAAGLGISLAGLGARSVLGPFGAIIPTISPLTGVLGGLVVGSDEGRAALAGLGQQAADFATGPGAKFLAAAATVADELSGGLAVVITEVGDAVFDAGSRVLPILGDALVDLGPPVSDLLSELGELTAAVLPELANFAGVVIPPAVDVLGAGVAVAADAVGLLADNTEILIPVLAGLAAIKFADQFRGFGDAVKGAVGNVGEFRDAVGQIAATQNVSKFEALKGVAGATVKEVGGMAGGFLAANGPLIALTGAAVIGSAAFAEYARNTADVRKGADDLASAIQTARDKFEELNANTMRDWFADKGALDSLNDLGLSFEDVTRLATESGDSLSGLDTIFKDVYSNNTGTIGKFKEALKDADVPKEISDIAVSIVEMQTAADGYPDRSAVLDFFEALDEVTQKTAGGISKARESLRSIAQEAAASGKISADELKTVLGEISDAKTPEQLNAAFSHLNDLLGITGDSARAAGDNMQRLLDLIDKFKNAPRDVDEGARRLAEARDRVTASLTAGTGINMDTETGRKNADAIKAMVDATERLAEAQAKLDPTGQQSTLTLLAQRAALEQLAGQGKITGDELQHLVDIYGLADTDITATVTANTEQAKASVVELRAEFDKQKADMEEPVRSKIEAAIDAGDYALVEALLNQLARDRDVQIRATVTTALGGVVAEVEKVTGTDINANGVIGRASGGPVWPGQPFLVGENGPELGFFPKDGQIIDAATTGRLLSPEPSSLTLDPLLAEVAAQRSEIRALVDAITAVVTRPQAPPVIDVRASAGVAVTAEQRDRAFRSVDR